MDYASNCNCGNTSTTDNCNCGPTCVGGLTCHCNDTTTFICPNGNCSVPSNGNGCGCNCPPDSPLPKTHRVNRLIAPSRGTHTYWTDKDPVIYEGVIGLTKDRLFPGSLEYFIGDGVHKYSELPKYGGAEASTSKKSNTLVLRDENGLIDPESISASVTKKDNAVVKADSNGNLNGWKDAIISAIIADDGSGGLSAGQDGNLEVDFDAMYTHNKSKFEALLKSLKMLIPLESNLYLYVNKSHVSAGDTIIENRGTQNLPFKTIQAAVNYVTQNFALGTHYVYINISSDTYTENVTLPEYSRTSGTITLKSIDYTNPASITNISVTGAVIGVSGGMWKLQCLNIIGVFSDPANGKNNYCYAVRCDNGNVDISGCALSGTYNGSSPANYMRMDLIAAVSGTITFSVIEGYHNTFTINKGNINVANVISAEYKATINFTGGNTADDGIMYDYPCKGTATTFALASTNSNIGTSGGYRHFPSFSVVNTFTGERYRVITGSGVSSLPGGFPGNGSPEDGMVEASTYSWYKHVATL